MSKRSEAVKKWRKATKSRLLKGMGGKCFVCDYNKCESALDFHHIDPSQKDFGLAAVRASIKNWSLLVEEVEKCVVLCSNCHREHHEGLLNISFIPKKFDEKLKNYKEIEREELYDPCPVCKTKKSKHLITCSPSCAAKKNERVDWKNIDLEKLYKTNTVIKIAKTLGVSDVTVHKKLKKLGLKQPANLLMQFK